MADKVFNWGQPITSPDDLPRDSRALGMTLKEIYDNRAVFIDYIMENLSSKIRTNDTTSRNYSAEIRGNLESLFEVYSTAPEKFHVADAGMLCVWLHRYKYSVGDSRLSLEIHYTVGGHLNLVDLVEEINEEFENSINSCTATVETETHGSTTINRLRISGLYTKEISTGEKAYFSTTDVFHYDNPIIMPSVSWNWENVRASWNRDSVPCFYSGEPFVYTYNSGDYQEFYFQLGNVSVTDRVNPSGKEEATSGKYPSGEMGGLGTFDDTTDLSDISSKPSLNISDLGFFSLWNPSAAQLRNLADYVWNDPTNVSQWPQIFQSGILKPLDYIMSLSLFPLSPTQMSLASKTFTMGGIVFDGRISALGKSITMNQITEQIVDVDMGTLSLKEYFGSFLDYAPYSQVSLYLPYYQTVQLSMNELQNADSINVRYRINLLDGSTAIKVHIDRQTSAAQNGSVPMKHVLYEFFTNLKTEIPLTSGQNTEQMKMLATVLCGAAAVVAAPVAGAGASALAGAAEGAATIGGMEGASLGAQVGNQAVGQAVSGAIKTGAGATNKAINSLPSGGGIQRGNIGGMNNGLLSERRPFLIVTRPIQILPADFGHKKGYSANITAKIGDLKGYIQTDNFKMQGTEGMKTGEIAEIESLLNSGVYI